MSCSLHMNARFTPFNTVLFCNINVVEVVLLPSLVCISYINPTTLQDHSRSYDTVTTLWLGHVPISSRWIILRDLSMKSFIISKTLLRNFLLHFFLLPSPSHSWMQHEAIQQWDNALLPVARILKTVLNVSARYSALESYSLSDTQTPSSDSLWSASNPMLQMTHDFISVNSVSSIKVSSIGVRSPPNRLFLSWTHPKITAIIFWGELSLNS